MLLYINDINADHGIIVHALVAFGRTSVLQVYWLKSCLFALHPNTPAEQFDLGGGDLN